MFKTYEEKKSPSYCQKNIAYFYHQGIKLKLIRQHNKSNKMTLLCDIIYSDDKNTETNTNKNVKKEKKKSKTDWDMGD